MSDNPHYDHLLTKKFFEEFYVTKQMSYPKIQDMLAEQGHNIHPGTLQKYAKKHKIGRDASEARRLWQEDSLDYDQTFLTERVIEAIDGFLLGDGGIEPMGNKPNSAISARLVCGVEHEEFCRYLMNDFNSYNYTIKKQRDSSMNQRFYWNARTRSHPDLKKQFDRWYPFLNDRYWKQPPNDVRITPLSVMMWYLGDGSLVQHGKNKTSVSCRLSTDGFEIEKVEMLAKKMNDLGIKCKRNGDNRIYIRAKGISAFFEFIGTESPIECYNYKFDLPKWRFEAKRMKQVAEELGVDYQKLAHLVKVGKIPCYRASENGKPRFMKEHIEEAKKILGCQKKSDNFNRSTFNYESTILKELTIEKEGYDPDKLGKTSTKFVWANCRYCGEEMRVRKGNFNKLGSACHSDCRIEQLKTQNSPFNSKEVQEKAKETMLARWGVEKPMQSKELLEKAAHTRRSTYSRIQVNINKLFEDWGFETKLDTKGVIEDHSLSIYIPAKKFAIEINDSELHSELTLESKEARNKHITKTKLCREKGIRLFHIFEHQWKEREHQILNFIKSILGVYDRRIFARKCELSNRCAKDFMKENHIQGYGAGTKRFFNLEYEGEIVASMSASLHHRQNVDSKDLVLNRLCFPSDTSVVGGASKLFKYFVAYAREEGYNRIVSWSDNCWTEGGIYEVLGFQLDKEYGPDYFYYDTKERRYRSKQSQKKSATGCPKEVTERDWCIEHGLYRLWDCGKRKWIYKL